MVRRKEDKFEVVETGRLEGLQLAQRAEVKAVIAALKWGKGKEITIYTDSSYAAGAAHC